MLVSGTAEANSTITVYDGTTAVGTATAGSNGAWSVTTGALTTGSHVLTATATDAAGNTSVKSAGMDPVIGSPTTPPPTQPTPNAPVITSGDHTTNDNTVTVTGTAVAGSTVTVFDGANKLGTATVASNGAWNYTTAALADGKHSLTATDTVSGKNQRGVVRRDTYRRHACSDRAGPGQRFRGQYQPRAGVRNRRGEQLDHGL